MQLCIQLGIYKVYNGRKAMEWRGGRMGRGEA